MLKIAVTGTVSDFLESYDRNPVGERYDGNLQIVMILSPVSDSIELYPPFLLEISSRHYALNSYFRDTNFILFRGLIETKISLQLVTIMHCG
jgi:hypothetical protein